MATKKLPPAPSPCRIVGKADGCVLGLTESSGRLVTSMMGHFRGGVITPQVSVWDSTSGALIGRFGSGGGSVCWQGALSPDASLLAAGFGDCTFRVWDVATGAEILSEKLGGIVASVSWSDDGRYVYTGNCGDHTLRLWDVSARSLAAKYKQPRSITWFTAMSGDALTAASANADKAVYIWDPHTGANKATLRGHAGKLLALAFSRDGRLLASASQDKTARVWEPSTQREVATLAGHKKAVTAVCFTDDCGVVTASLDGTVRLWRGPELDEVRAWNLGETSANGVASRGGEVFAGCTDGLVRAFEV